MSNPVWIFVNGTYENFASWSVILKWVSTASLWGRHTHLQVKYPAVRVWKLWAHLCRHIFLSECVLQTARKNTHHWLQAGFFVGQWCIHFLLQCKVAMHQKPTWPHLTDRAHCWRSEIHEAFCGLHNVTAGRENAAMLAALWAQRSVGELTYNRCFVYYVYCLTLGR